MNQSKEVRIGVIGVGIMGTNRLEVAGDRGRVVLENGQLVWTRNTVSMAEFRAKEQTTFAKPETWKVEIPCDGRGGQHDAIMQNYIDAILDGVPLIAPAEEGINSVELCNSMLYSSFTGKPVDLPIDSSSYSRLLKKLIRDSTFRKNANIDLAGKEIDMTASSSVFSKQ